MVRKGKRRIVAALSGRNIRNIRRFGPFGNVFQGAGKLLCGGDAQVFQLLGPGDEPVFKRGNGFIVLGYRLVQALAQRGKMTGRIEQVLYRSAPASEIFLALSASCSCFHP